MRWNPNNGVRHTRGSYFWIFIFRMPSIHQSVGPHRRERRERCSTRWEGGEEDARRALVNPIILVSIIALSGGKSRKFLGISIYNTRSQLSIDYSMTNKIAARRPRAAAADRIVQLRADLTTLCPLVCELVYVLL
jgi:hypothetical protein